MPRKLPITSTSEQRKEQYRKAKAHRQEEHSRRAAARVAEARAVRRVGPGGTGRPFGTTGGYLKPWMKRILGNFYTDVDLIRDFILLTPKERIQFIAELDPKIIGEGSPEEIAFRIKAVLDAIQKSVPTPERARQP
jgi:hypothetical protein